MACVELGVVMDQVLVRSVEDDACLLSCSVASWITSRCGQSVCLCGSSVLFYRFIIEAIYIVYPSIHPLLHGLSTHRCSFAIFTIVLHVPRSCAFQLSVWISSPRHSLMSSNHSLHGLPLLYSSVPPSFQTSPPSPAYCPSSCICVQTG